VKRSEVKLVYSFCKQAEIGSFAGQRSDRLTRAPAKHRHIDVNARVLYDLGMNNLSTSKKVLLAIAITLSPLIFAFLVASIFSVSMGMGAFIFLLPAIFGTIPLLLIGVIDSIIKKSVILRAFYIPAVIIVILIIITPLIWQLIFTFSIQKARDNHNVTIEFNQSVGHVLTIDNTS